MIVTLLLTLNILWGVNRLIYDPKHVPTIREFCILVGRLGGFRPTKRQPLPGLKLLDRALEKMNLLIDSYLAFNPKYFVGCQ